MYKCTKAVTEENIHEAATWLTEQELACRLNDMNETAAAEAYLGYEENDPHGELFGLLREEIQAEVRRLGMGDEIFYSDLQDQEDAVWIAEVVEDMDEGNAFRVLAEIVLGWQYGEKLGLGRIHQQRVKTQTFALIEAAKRAGKKKLLSQYVAEVTHAEAFEIDDSLPIRPGYVVSLRGIEGVIDSLAKVRGGDLKPSDVVTWLQR